jgi:hypothetical protein
VSERQGDAMTETDERVTQKDEAYQFLKEMRRHLNATLPAPEQMQKEFERWSRAQEMTTKKSI